MYPGIGQTKPSGLKSIISLFWELERFKLPLWIIGMKNIEIKIENKIIINIIFLNKFEIKIPPLIILCWIYNIFFLVMQYKYKNLIGNSNNLHFLKNFHILAIIACRKINKID